ncbi:Methyltransferase domain-containing protein [Catalinimonas alkaloidigena]|uniref:Methyltransferase domain-containing protein n=1 Tax=Catalinimonas alkaloidigena TaxID=1075417 RepID=A0A1G9AC73_9BACT|nr:class I SAM-dependent methyltransferase [Catalinimonas alkaloidigena]SDK24982.1 Methyltransferase domain-containing protein [Catalinimonas alkaloidigena]
MTEFWESSFRDKQTMWGFAPADSAVATAALFQAQGLRNVLIPGFGYGRNAAPFTDQGANVTGIEISETAIHLARQHYGDRLQVHHGSVTDMPFDQRRYDGVFCYALIHLLDAPERAKLIADCYRQLRPGGFMVFVAISTRTAAYGDGIARGKNQFETRHGVTLFFYDAAAVEEEFGRYGLMEAKEIDEPAQQAGPKPSQKFWQITCRKPA